MEKVMGGLTSCFWELRDPRSSRLKRHDLYEILMIALCAILSGGQNAVDMEIFAEAKQDFLARFLPLRNGIPSHDTFSRFFSRLDPDQLRACFQKFVARFGETSNGVIAIDGKTLFRSSDPRRARSSALHMISAWCCERRLVLAQIAIGAKSQESAGVLKLLGCLPLAGRIVTTDALNCRRDIARQIVARGGEYAFALKRNHRKLHDEVSKLLKQPRYKGGGGHSTVDSNHGRVERRTSFVCSEIEELQKHHRWPGLAAVGKVIRARGTAAQATIETAYYLLSKPFSPEGLSKVVRSHWGVENRLHWVLNTVMNEDHARNRDENTAYNLAILRHMALNLMQKDRSSVSLRSKFNLAGWKDEFLAQLLAPI
jgi:predicted transposase YbfD/YdcC